MKANLAHKIRIIPNIFQENYFNRACGIARHAYNWALDESRTIYEIAKSSSVHKPKFPSKYDLGWGYNQIKKEEFPWTAEVTKWSPQMGTYNAHTALERWLSGVSKRPRFKKKGRSKDSFYLGPDAFHVDGKYVTIANLYDPKSIKKKLYPIRMYQELRFPKENIKCATISKENDRWYISILVEIATENTEWKYPHVCETQADVVGIDLGTRKFAVTSDGEIVENPKFLIKKQKKLRILQKSFSRKQKGSKNKEKARKRLSEAHRKIKDSRKDFLHKLTTSLVRSYGLIVIEDLNVAGMKKMNFSKRMESFGEFRRQLEYKAPLAGSEVYVVSRWFPSSKLCSSCGYKNSELKFEEEWSCPHCRCTHDRDVNASTNLVNVGYTRRHRGFKACGDKLRPEDIYLKALSMKQEVLYATTNSFKN